MLSLALCAGLLATGCSALSPDGAREAAEQTATALSAGTLEGMDLEGADDAAARARHERVVAGLGDAKPVVEVSAVEDTGQEDRREAVEQGGEDLGPDHLAPMGFEGEGHHAGALRPLLDRKSVV